MKLKIFKRTLSLIMILLFIPTFFTANAEGIIPSATVKVEFQGWDENCYKNVKANISLTSSESVILGIVTYKNNLIQKMTVENYDVDENNKLTTSLSLSDIPKTDTVKVMAWDKNLKPLYNGDYESENVLYVSNSAENNGDGTSVSPFTSLESAYDVAKNMNCDVTISVLKGTYNVTSPIELNGSSQNSKITFKGDKDGETVIDGGKKLGEFSQVSGENYFVCDVEGENGIYELYVNNHRAKMAQSENSHFPTSVTEDDNYGIFTFSGENSLPFDFSNSKDMLISSVSEWSYALSKATAFEYCDSDNQTLKIPKDNYNTFTLFKSSSNPLVFMNSMELLDSPGEFYYDKENKKLYYYPLSGENAENITAYFPMSEGLLKINNAKNVTFKNFSFKHGTWNKPYVDGYQNGQAECYLLKSEELAKRRKDFPKIPPDWTNTWIVTNPAQVELSYCKNVVFENNNFSNMGAGAIKFDDKNVDCNVNGNIFYDIGGASVTIGAPWHNDILFGNIDKITKNISVTNNLIRKTAQVLQGSCAISAYYTNACNISNNDIAESSYSGITLGWGWGNDVSECKDNIISNNKIVNILADLWDGNHIYTLGNMPGTKIEGNYCGRTDKDCGGGGFYPDEGSMNMEVNNNVIENGRNWTFNLTDKLVKRVATDSTGKGVYDVIPKNITYRGNFVNFLYKYRATIITVDGVPQYSKSVQEKTPDEILAGFTELSDFSQNAEAQAIINKAGLETNYKYLQNELSKMELSVDNGVKKSMYFGSDDYFEICAGDCIFDGGNEVSYSAKNEPILSDGCNYYVNRGGRYNNIGLSEYGGYKGSWVTYNVTPEKSGIYNIYLNAGSTGRCNFELSIDGKAVNRHAAMKATGGYGKLSHSLIACGVSLEANKTYTLKLEESRGAASVYSLVFDRIDDILSENLHKNCETETIASEDFTAYPNKTYSITNTFGTKLNSAPLNGGTGFSGNWYDNYTAPESNISSSTGYFAKIYTGFSSSENAVYTKNQRLYRKLEKTITLTEDKILRIEFTSRFGNSSNSYSGFELLRDLGYASTTYKTGNYQQQAFALGSYSNDSKSTYQLMPWFHNLVETFSHDINSEENINTEKALSKDTFYNYVAEIEVNADNKEKIRIKAYNAGSSEPENWDYVFEKELGTEPITHVSFNCQNETYIKNFNIKSYKKELLASEDFGAYTIDGKFPEKTGLGTLLNEGTGFTGYWYDNTSNPEKGVTGQGSFGTHLKNAVYLYQKRLYNKLENPISLNEKKTIRVEFVSLFQQYTRQFSGLEVLDDKYNIILGSGSYSTYEEDDPNKKYFLNAWTSNNLDSRMETEKELYLQNYYYRYVMEIDVNPHGEETIRIKAYDVTKSEGEEPQTWDLTFKKELGTEPITYIALNCNNITYFNSLKIYNLLIQ